MLTSLEGENQIFVEENSNTNFKRSLKMKIYLK